MGMGQLANQAMGAEQAQLAPDGGGATPCGLFVPGLSTIEVELEVAVAKSGDGPIAPAQYAQQWGINAQGLEGAVTPAIVSGGTAKGSGQLAQGSAHLRAGQRIEVTHVGRTADLGPAR